MQHKAINVIKFTLSSVLPWTESPESNFHGVNSLSVHFSILNLLSDKMDGIGVIIPPPEVRNILETTASFVGRKPALESKVRQRHQDDPRFTFLHPSDPYHAYFRQKVARYRIDSSVGPDESDHHANFVPAENASTENVHPKNKIDPNVTTKAESSDGNEGPVHFMAEPMPKKASPESKGGDEDKQLDKTVPDENTTQGTAVISMLKAARAKAYASRPEPKEPPSEDLFTLPLMNPSPNPLAFDVMKLAAQFIAKFGASFQNLLSKKEGRNPLFDFLKPLHPHFLVFQRLIDAYKLIFDDGEAKQQLLSKLRNQAEDPDAFFREVWYLHDWECQKAEREHEAALDEREKIRLAQIDWHDFVLVATIDFDDAEVANLPNAVSDAQQLPKMLAAAQKAQVEREKNKGDIDMDVDESVQPETKEFSRPLSTNRHFEHESIQRSNSSQRPLPPFPQTGMGNLNRHEREISQAHQGLVSRQVNEKKSALSNVSSSHAGEGDLVVPKVLRGPLPKDARVELVDVDSEIPAGRIRRVLSGISSNAGKIGVRAAEATVVLPSGQRVPFSKAESSIRAELLDPSYKHERARAAEKNKQQNLAGGEEVARNLARLEQARHDGGVFNRADLQEALAERRLVPESVVNARVKKPAKAGPELPVNENVHEGHEAMPPAAKRARVEAAVDVLSKRKEKEDEPEMDDGVDAVEDSAIGTDILPGLLSADEWMKKHGTTAKVRIKVCRHPNKDWELRGQEIEMSAPLKSTVSKLKNVMTKYTKLPANKQKLQMEKVGFLKDQMTLACYNVGDGTLISLEVKERGGRKKH